MGTLSKGKVETSHLSVAGELAYTGGLMRVTWRGEDGRAVSWWVAVGESFDDARLVGREGSIHHAMGGTTRVAIRHRGCLVPIE